MGRSSSRLQRFLSTLSLRRATRAAGRRLYRRGSRWISIHALLAESDAFCQPLLASVMQFLSTLSLRRATDKSSAVFNDLGISIHALLAESDLGIAFTQAKRFEFLSTLSLRRATAGGDINKMRRVFLSTLSLRRATYDTYAKVLRVNISIHALLAESDAPGTSVFRGWTLFLSTLSLRRATALIRYLINTYHNFYPRSPCGERLIIMLYNTSALIFLSTLSLRRAT